MIRVFEAETADGAWQRAADFFRRDVGPREQSSNRGPTVEVLGVGFSLAKPRQRWIPSRVPALNPAFAIAEVVWIVRGRNDSAFANHWNPVLPRFAGHGDSYHGAYGFRFRNHFGFDQLERAYHILLNDPDSRQVVLQIWDSSADLPNTTGKPVSEDVPCNICAMLKVRDSRLEWTQIMRSNDLVLGFPHNVVQFTFLQEILAGWLCIEPGIYRHFADSLHVYSRDIAVIESSIPIDAAYSTDSISVRKDESDRLFADMENRMDRMIRGRLNPHDLERLAEMHDAPTAYGNLMLIVAADDARRRGWLDLAEQMAARCANPALVQLWNRWAERKARVRHP